MDLASIGGILLALAGILGGLLLEGGTLAQITQPTAMMIVLGGTMGAILLQFPLPVVATALRQGARVFFVQPQQSEAAITLLVRFAAKARRTGIISLDPDLDQVEDPFLQRALMLGVDGCEPAEVRAIMQLELENTAGQHDKIPQVFEAIGGYAPTVGILGAILGLIQVMQHLDDIAAVGRGIAVAFVATIYGVALANLVALPIAGKLRTRIETEETHNLMLLEGVVSLLEGMNPRLLETRLRTFVPGNSPAATKAERTTEVSA